MGSRTDGVWCAHTNTDGDQHTWWCYFTSNRTEGAGAWATKMMALALKKKTLAVLVCGGKTVRGATHTQTAGAGV